MQRLWLCALVGVGLINLVYGGRTSGLQAREQVGALDSDDLDDVNILEIMDLKDISLNSSSLHRGRQRQKRATAERSAETRASNYDALNQRRFGRYCGELSGALFTAEVRAVNRDWFILTNLHWAESLDSVQAILFKTTYEEYSRAFQSVLRLTPAMKMNIETLRYLVKFGTSHEKTLKFLEAYNGDTLELLASLNLAGCRPPRSAYVGPLIETSRGISSGHITLLSANEMLIHDFIHTDPNIKAVFWAGYGAVHEGSGYIIPVKGSTDPIRNYYQENVVLRLPLENTFYDLDYVSVMSAVYKDSLGHVYVTKRLWQSDLLPPPDAEGDVPNYATYEL